LQIENTIALWNQRSDVPAAANGIIRPWTNLLAGRKPMSKTARSVASPMFFTFDTIHKNKNLLLPRSWNKVPMQHCHLEGEAEGIEERKTHGHRLSERSRKNGGA
jgi:hypothetical protein